jgi:hypothetical protein
MFDGHRQLAGRKGKKYRSDPAAFVWLFEVLIHGGCILGSNGFKLALTGAIGLWLVEFSARRGSS